jgi:hypothetical protein
MTDYHWSPANQRAFLEQLAIGGNISEAAKSVSMSAQAAYNLATRAAGRVFALGWDAAVLIARRRLEGELMERALAGQEETYERDPDTGIVKRCRIHNGVTMAMLKRLDTMVAGQIGKVGANAPADAAMARIVAQDFERFLDLIEAGGSGAEAMLFLKARDGALLPMAHMPGAIEALEFAKQHQLSQKSVVSDGQENAEAVILTTEEQAAEMTIWYCDYTDSWRTDFPPPEDFYGDEEGEFGSPDYSRELDAEEEECRLRIAAEETAPLRAAGEVARLAWFGMIETKAADGSMTKGLTPHGDCPQTPMSKSSASLQNQAHGEEVPSDTDPAISDIAPVKPEVITHQPVYMKSPRRYLDAGQIPPWGQRIA